MALLGQKKKIHQKKYKYKNYLLTYNLYYEKRQYVALSEAFEGADVTFTHKNKKMAASLMRSWFKEVIDSRKIHEVLKDDHDILIVAPDLLKTVREGHFAYHICDSELHNQIQKNGLIPCGTPNEEVDLASKEIDKYKAHWIPEWVKRSEALYFHPELTNFFLETNNEKNSHLYAVCLKDKPAWMGSIALGGFALFGDWMMDDEQELKEHAQLIKEEYGPEYWKYSSSLSEYIRESKHVKAKEKQCIIDEILVFESIPTKEVFHIGSWNEEGQFSETPDFTKFVKDNLKKHYKDILKLYTY